MSRLNVLVADDHRLMLAGIRRALEASDETHVVGEARTGMQVIPAIAATNPDVVLLDIRMPGLDGITCLTRIRERYPLQPVVMLSTYGDAEHVEAARAGGANAYVSKRIDPLALPGLLRTIVDGAPFAVYGLEPSTADANTDGLTEREIAVLRAVACGRSNRDIGKDLWVSEQTVKFHLRNIYRKLEISSRAEATRYAFEHQIVDSLSAVAGL
jgi:DNA-binding NarL/FixJ family response regulator